VKPPGTFGGNMDTQQLMRDSTLHQPVQVEQALFSRGDAHGARASGRAPPRSRQPFARQRAVPAGHPSGMKIGGYLQDACAATPER
jgi:hypothetical protein